jgi:hypothetical protein
LFDGSTVAAPSLAILNGTTLPSTIRTSTGVTLIRLLSNGVTSGAGFDLNYNAVPFQCGTTTLVAATGIVEDGSGQSRYQNNLNCLWTIQPSTSFSFLEIVFQRVRFLFSDIFAIFVIFVIFDLFIFFFFYFALFCSSTHWLRKTIWPCMMDLRS